MIDLSRHRNLYNGDCTFLFVGNTYNPSGGRYSAKVFHDFVALLARSGIDTYLQNPGAQVPWYPSKVLPHVLTGYVRGDRNFTRGHYPPTDEHSDFTAADLEQRLDADAEFLGHYLDLLEDGVDWVAEVAKACRAHGIAPWLSMRMNDLHGANSWEGSYMNNWVQKEPRFRLSGQQINPRDGLNRFLQAHSYEHPEVRDFYFAMIRELVEDYDYEGLELDWLRCPFAIEPPATQAQCDVLTDWTAEIRALTRARARVAGRPYPLGVRVPVRLGLLKTHGLDVMEWVRRGLIDWIGPSNGWQTTWDVPYDQLRAQCDAAGTEVKLFGVIEDAPNWDFGLDPSSGRSSYRLLSASRELLRGNAAGKLAMGCDAIEQFNFFCTEESHHNPVAGQGQARYDELRDLDKLDRLRGQEKHYALASMHGYFMFPLLEYAEQVPAVLEPEWKKAFRVSMCAEPADQGLELVVQLVVEKREGQGMLPDLGVSFNGCWPSFAGEATDQLLFPTGIYTHHAEANVALDFRFEASLIMEGWNEVLVFNGSHQRATPAERQAHSVTIVSLELAVKRK